MLQQGVPSTKKLNCEKNSRVFLQEIFFLTEKPVKISRFFFNQILLNHFHFFYLFYQTFFVLLDRKMSIELQDLPDFMVSINGKPLDPLMLATYENNERKRWNLYTKVEDSCDKDAGLMSRGYGGSFLEPDLFGMGYNTGNTMTDDLYPFPEKEESDYNAEIYLSSEEKDESEEILRSQKMFEEEVERDQSFWKEECEDSSFIEHCVFEQIRRERYTKPPYLSQVRSPLIKRKMYLEQFFDIPIDTKSYEYWGSNDPITLSIWQLDREQERWDALYHCELPNNFTTMLYCPDEQNNPNKLRFELEHPLIIDFTVDDDFLKKCSQIIENNGNQIDFATMDAINNEMQTITLSCVLFPRPDRFNNIQCIPDNYFIDNRPMGSMSQTLTSTREKDGFKYEKCKQDTGYNNVMSGMKRLCIDE